MDLHHAQMNPARDQKDWQLTILDRLIIGMLLLVGVFACVLRFVSLNYGYSFDEVFSVMVARMPWHALVQTLHAEGTNPIAYFALVKIWGALTGFGDVSVRILSSLLGTVAAFLLGFMARSWWGRRAGALAFALGSGSAVLFIMSREARMYALLSLLIIGSMLLFWRWQERRSASAAVSYGIVTMMALLTHMTAITVVCAQAAFVLLMRATAKQRLLRMVIVMIPVILSLAVWYVGVFQFRIAHPIGYPIFNRNTHGFLSTTFEVLRDYVTFYHGAHVMPHAVVPPFYVARGLMALTTVAGFLTAVVYAIRRTMRPDHPILGYVLLTFLCGMVPVALLRPMPKYFLSACIAMLLLVVYGLRVIWRRSVIAALCIAIVIAAATTTELPAIIRGEALPWPLIGRFVDQTTQQNDLILVHLWPDELTLRRYTVQPHDIRGIFPISTPPSFTSAMVFAHYNPAQVVTPNNIGPWLESVTSGRSRVWLVYINNDLFFNGHNILEWFDAHGWKLTSEPDISYAPSGTMRLYERITP